MPSSDQFTARIDDAQGFESEEIHLEQPCIFHHIVVELSGHHHGLFGPHDGNQVVHLFGSDDHATGVDTGIPERSLDLHGRAQHATPALVYFGDAFQLIGVVELLPVVDQFSQFPVCTVEQLTELQPVRHEFGQAVDLFDGDVQYPRSIADGTLCGHGAVGDDVRHLVTAVGIDDVLNDLVPSDVIKINIDIGQADAVGIEEPLKQKTVFEWIDIGDARAVGYNGARGRSASRSNAHSHFSGFAREVLYDEEIARISSTFDGSEFKIQAIADLFGERFAITLLGALIGQVPQIGIFTPFAFVFFVRRIFKGFRDIEFWQQYGSFQRIGLDPLHHLRRAGQCLG